VFLRTSGDSFAGSPAGSFFISFFSGFFELSFPLTCRLFWMVGIYLAVPLTSRPFGEEFFHPCPFSFWTALQSKCPPTPHIWVPFPFFFFFFSVFLSQEALAISALVHVLLSFLFLE